MTPGPWQGPEQCLQPAEGWDASRTPWELEGRCPPSLDGTASGCKGPQPERAPSLPAPTSVDSHRSGRGEASGLGLVPQDSSRDAPGLGARAGRSGKEGIPQSRPEPCTRPAGLLSAWPLQSRRAGHLTSGGGSQEPASSALGRPGDGPCPVHLPKAMQFGPCHSLMCWLSPGLKVPPSARGRHPCPGLGQLSRGSRLARGEPALGGPVYLTLSGPPWEDSAGGFLGGQDRSEPPGLQVTHTPCPQIPGSTRRSRSEA